MKATEQSIEMSMAPERNILKRLGRMWPVFCILLTVSTVASTTDSPPPVQTAERAELELRYTLDYWLYLPDGYAADTARRWPLVVFLHGASESGTDLEQVKRHGPPRRITEGHKFPFIVVSPQNPQGSRWEVLALEGFIEEMQRRYRADATRVYLTGLSMGGFAAWGLAVRHPERYAAIVPICGGGDPRRAARLRDLPIWAFHGAKDEIVPLSGSQAMIDAIKAAGGTPRFTIYPDAAHDSWTETYANEAVYEWLLQQQLPATAR